MLTTRTVGVPQPPHDPTIDGYVFLVEIVSTFFRWGPLSTGTTIEHVEVELPVGQTVGYADLIRLDELVRSHARAAVAQGQRLREPGVHGPSTPRRRIRLVEPLREYHPLDPGEDFVTGGS